VFRTFVLFLMYVLYSGRAVVCTVQRRPRSRPAGYAPAAAASPPYAEGGRLLGMMFPVFLGPSWLDAGHEM
jgi:hypothetical protein